MDDWFEFEVVQNGQVVAGVGGPNREAALKEAMHYAMVYGQDGPCEIRDASDDETPAD